jgi:hypothetical protein
MKYIVVFLVLVGFVGFAFAEHDSNQPQTHSIILPDNVKEKTFDEFMEWCAPYYKERCTDIYEKNKTSELSIPLKLNDLASKLWYDHDYIIDGTILDIRGHDQPERVYDIQINSFFKPEEGTGSKIITVYGSPNFYSSKGDSGIFFIKKDDARWIFGEYGAKATPECPPELMYHPPLEPQVYTRVPASGINFDYVIDCYPHYYKKYLPQYLKTRGVTEFPSPLSQQMDRVSPEEVVCNEGLELILKNNRQAACVKPETKTKLIERGWVEPDNSLHTLLGKTLDGWRKYTYDELRQISETDKDFNRELGRLAIKEHMQEQLALNNITNSHDDFKVFSGYSETYSVGYNSVVNATDGKSYLMLGSARFHIVGDYFELRKLSFDSQDYDNTQHPYYLEKPVVEISVDPNNKSQISNTNVIIHLNQTNFVTFQNNLPITIRIQEFGSDDIDEQENLNWIGPTLQPGMSGNVTFSDPGYYRWSANEPPEPFGLTWYGKGSGYITVISDDVDDLPFTTKNKMAGSFVKQSDVPWGGLGVGNNHGVVVHLYPAVYDMMRDAQDYYAQHLEELIPFDVPLILVEPKNYDYGQNYENEN